MPHFDTSPDAGELPPFFGEAMIALAKMRGLVTSAEYLTLIFIAERTFRFKKLVELIPVRHFLEGIFDDARGEIVSAPLGLSRRTVEGCLRSLIEKGLLIVDRIEAKGYDARAKWLRINIEDARFQAMLPVRKRDKAEGKSAPQVRQNLPARPAKSAVQEHYDKTSFSLRSKRAEFGEEIEEDREEPKPAKPAPIQAAKPVAIETAVARVDQLDSRPMPVKTKAQLHAAAMRRLDQVARKRPSLDLASFRSAKARAQVLRWLTTSAQGHSGETAARNAVEAFGWLVENWDLVSTVRLSWMDQRPTEPTPSLFGSASIGSTLFSAYTGRGRLKAEYDRKTSGVEIQIDGFMKKGMSREDAEVRVEANLRRAAAASTLGLHQKTGVRADIKPAVEQKGAGRGFGRERLPAARTTTQPRLTDEEVGAIHNSIDWAAASKAPAWEDE